MMWNSMLDIPLYKEYPYDWNCIKQFLYDVKLYAYIHNRYIT